MNAPHNPAQQPWTLDGPVAILWDIENSPVPTDIHAEDVARNIRLALRVHPLLNGAVTLFSAYGNFNAFPRKLREGCQRTGMKLVDVPNGIKDAADKAILIDMFLFALDNRPPSSIMLISGDVDFSPALHILGERRYTVILVISSRLGVSSALTNAGRFVWDWHCVAHGKGFVWEEEAIVYRGISQTTQIHCFNSISESLRSQSLPSALNEAPVDIQGLKGQLARLCEVAGGTLSLVQIPSEYLKSFGQPLYMAEYGVYKLMNLIQKMSDTFVVIGKGPNKVILLRNIRQRQIKKCLNRKRKKIMEGTVDIGICRNIGSSSDELSEEERSGDYDERFDGFRQEVQELLVCYGYLPVPLGVFESLYEQRYKRALDFQRFGVDGLEELMEKVKDVVVLCEDNESKRKVIRLDV